MNIWEENKHKVVQIDMSVTKRQSKWILVCTTCQCEREASYGQAWNIVKGKGNGNCFNCIDRNVTGLHRVPWNKGKTWSKSKSESQSNAMQYIHTFASFVTEEGRKKQRLTKLGKRGIETNAYIDGRTKINQKLRTSVDYKEWRLAVLKRDNFTCQFCSKRGIKLQVDHIKSFSKFPELRLDLDNGRSLCVPCHKTTPTYCRG